MKLLLYFQLIILLISACTPYHRKKELKPTTKLISKKEKEIKPEDEPIVIAYAGEVLTYIDAKEYRTIIKNELKEIPQFSKMHPDTLYFKKAYNTLKFGSEQGQDLFFQVYAHYLTLHENKGIPKSKITELEKIYYKINVFIGESVAYGSGFYHTIQRIPAYVNYDFLSYDRKIYQQQANPNEKKKFLDLIRRNIPKDREFILSSFIDDLEKEITTEFQLTKTKAFTKTQFGHLLN
jgi:hypothetical protein